MWNWFRVVNNSDRYALSDLPPSQRFQLMSTLSLMWTAIFCGATGAWFWYGHVAFAHVLIVLGLVATETVFRTARRSGQRANVAFAPRDFR